MLAITWSVEKYHQYTYGRQTTVKSDHKPLERIMIKPLKDIPWRLHGFRLRLQNYDITVQYKPGSEQYIADRLSRSPQPYKESSDISYEIEVNAV